MVVRLLQKLDLAIVAGRTEQGSQGLDRLRVVQLGLLEQCAGDAATDLEIYNQAMGAQFQNFRQLNDYMRDAYIQDEKRLTPIINQRKNAELARNQALMNTMTNNYSRLGMLATAGKLATGAQAERGATMRTALQSNPYSGAIMQAPSISF